MWSILVPANELQLHMMKYSVSLPILGPCGCDCSVEKEVIDGAIRLRHTGWRGCVTQVVIELPGDADGSQCVVNHGGNTPLTLSVEHRLHSRWWDGVVALCIAAYEGDGVLWDKAWATLERVALEVGATSVRERAKALMEATPLAADVATCIAERSFLAEEGWMQGGALSPLQFAHTAMDREQPAPGALGRLEQLLTSGGLTSDEIVTSCTRWRNMLTSYGFVRKRRGPGWVEYDGVETVHEAVVRCTGMSVGELLTGVHSFVEGTLSLPESAEERAAIKARVHADVR